MRGARLRQRTALMRHLRRIVGTAAVALFAAPVAGSAPPPSVTRVFDVVISGTTTLAGDETTSTATFTARYNNVRVKFAHPPDYVFLVTSGEPAGRVSGTATVQSTRCGAPETVRYTGRGRLIFFGNNWPKPVRRGAFPGKTSFLLHFSSRLPDAGPQYHFECRWYESDPPQVLVRDKRLVAVFADTEQTLMWDFTQKQSMTRLSYPLSALFRGRKVVVSVAADVPADEGRGHFTGRVRITFVPRAR